MNRTRDMIAALEKSATFTSTEATRSRRSWHKSHIKVAPKSPIKAAVEVALKHRSGTKNPPGSRPPSGVEEKVLSQSEPKLPAKAPILGDKIHATVKKVIEEQLAEQIRGFALQHERLEEELLKTQIENEALKKRQLEMESNLTKLSSISAEAPKPPPKDGGRPATQLIATIQTIISDHEQEKYRDLSAMYVKLRGQQRNSRERYEGLKQEHRTLQRKFETFAKLADEHIGTIEVRLRDLQDRKPYDADTPPPVPRKDNISDKNDFPRAWKQDLGTGIKQMWRELRETKMRCERMMARLVPATRERVEGVQSRQSSHKDVTALPSPTMTVDKDLPELPGSQVVPESVDSRYGEIYIEAPRNQSS